MTWDPAIATAVGALAGALNNYVLCSQVVFGGNSDDRHLPDHTRPARSLIRFFCVATILALLNGVCLYFLHQGISSVLVAQLLSTSCLLPAGFILNKHWSFAQSSLISPEPLS